LLVEKLGYRSYERFSLVGFCQSD